MNKSDYLLVEKYRPASLDNFIGNESVNGKVGKMIASGDIPHLLFSGSPGTGKTTLAKIIVKNIQCDYVYINASDDNSVDIIRTKIKDFASVMGLNPIKIVILDEADFLSLSAQAALRSMMEVFSKTTRFILTCNYQERILDAIISRTQQFHIEPPSRVDVAKHVAHIMKLESIEFQPADIKLLVDAYYPDIRKTINEAQLHMFDARLHLDPEEIIDGDVKLKIIEILKERGKAKERLNQIRQLIVDADIRDFSQYYDLLNQEITTYAEDHISQVILHIAEGVRWDPICLNKTINFLAVITNILGELK